MAVPAAAEHKAAAAAAPSAAAHAHAHHHVVDDPLHPEWTRRPRMYDLQNMKHRGLKMGAAVWGVFALGVIGPLAIVRFQMKKSQG